MENIIMTAPLIDLKKSYQWYHLVRDAKETAPQMKDLKVPDLAVKGLMADETRPRISSFDGGYLIILRGVNMHPEANPEDMISIRLWVTDNLVVSVYRRQLLAVEEMKAEIANKDIPKDPGAFLARLASKLLIRIQSVVSAEDELLDEVEESLIQENDLMALRHQLTRLRTEAITLRRYITPQREVMNALINIDRKWMNTEDQTSLRESLDNITRLVENLDLIRERAGILQDEIGNRYNDKINKNMYVLSLVATIFLPLGFLTGLLGINVGGIPGAENPLAFYIFCAILIIITGGAITFFRIKKWV